MEPHITVVTLGVDDLDRAVDFYGDGLAFPVAERFEQFVLLELRDQFLGLYPAEAHASGAGLTEDDVGTGGISLAHNVGTRAAVDAVMGEADAAGATITKPATETPWGGYSGYFTDPDGHLWEVATGADFAADLL